MTCERCGKEPATVHIRQVADRASATERHLCEACAREEFPAEVPASSPGPAGQIPCEACGVNPATVHIDELSGGAPTARHLCEACHRREQSGEPTAPAAPPRRHMTLAKQAHDAIAASAEAKMRFAAKAAQAVAQAAALIAEAIRGGHKVLLCGNGGSAADAQHIAGELVGRFQRERPAFAALALTTDTSVLTAIANDYGFEEVFARQVEALGAAGDILMAYSTSGGSANVVAAIEKARSRGMKTIGLTGAAGGRVAELADIAIKAPSDETPTIQECHGAAGHTICLLVEQLLCE